jgi:hypothetical protein
LDKAIIFQQLNKSAIVNTVIQLNERLGKTDDEPDLVSAASSDSRGGKESNFS